MTSTDYEFEWDDAKAVDNLAKHEVAFSDAMTVLRDPLAMNLFDNDHSDDEDRWITLGTAANGKLLLVVHTFTSLSATSALVRIISAREPTRNERTKYENNPKP
jgi:uncharacterized protein